MKKTILYLRTDILDHELIAGGSVTHTLGVLQGFHQLGYRLICASSCMIDQLNKLPFLSVKILNNPSWLKFLRWKINCVLSNIFFTVQVLRLLKRNKVDFIYQRYSILNAVGLLVSKLRKIPFILEYNGSESWANKHWAKKNSRLKLHWLIEWVEQKNITKADYVVVVSQVLKDELVARGVPIERILVNPNGVDPEIYNPERLQKFRAAIRRQLGVQSHFVFGFIGTFSQWHGIESIAEIIKPVVYKYPEAHFLFIGDGPLKQPLKNKCVELNILQYVTFTGLLPPDQAQQYMSACDAYLSPTQPNPDNSRFFGSPTKLFEYMSMAKPIIASNLEQLATILSPAISVDKVISRNTQACGILIQPNNLPELMNALLLILRTDKNYLTILGNNARKKVIQHHSWQQHVLFIEKMFKKEL